MGMNRRRLGGCGIEVSEIAFGTVSLGVPYGIGIKGRGDMPPESDAVDLLRAALDRGVNLFDTGRAYGCSEEILGKAFQGRRQDVVICTKCAHLYDKDGQLPPASALKKAIDESFGTSLSALQTHYVDVYMVHNADLAALSNHTITETFSGYRQKGLARTIGVSTYSVAETRKAIESGVWNVVQVAYNLMDQRQGELFCLANQQGVGIVVRSVLLKGILTDRGRNLHPKLKAVQQHRRLYYELLGERAPTLSDLATRFVLSQRGVSSVLVGIDSPEYLDKALMAADGSYLDEGMLARARELAYGEPEFLDLPRWEQMGWLT